MGRKVEIKKIQMNADKDKTSSSKKNRDAETVQNMDYEKDTKKLKNEAEAESQMEVGVEQASINNLPQEMLMKILKNVDAVNLLACRVANRNWNMIANELFLSKVHPEIKINCFELGSTPGVGKRSLKNFLKLSENSNNCLFSRFLCQVKKYTIDHTEWTKFISDFRENIKCLKLEISYDSVSCLREIEGRLRFLLWNQLPNLQELGIQFKDGTGGKRFMRLFEYRASVPGPADRLPNLKVLYVDADSLTNRSLIISDLLRVAVNLESIQPFQKDKYFTLSEDIVRFLHSRGKLDCVPAAELELTPYFVREMKEKSPMTFKLMTLKLKVKPIYSKTSLHNNATDFLHNLFESSKDTLRKLTMEPIGFLRDFELPKLDKLTNLTIKKSIENMMSVGQILPSGINPMEVFPVLHSLVLEIPWTTVFPPEDSFACFPTVKNLKVAADGMSKATIAQISEMCPNLKHFAIGGKAEPIDNFPKVGKAIWTHLKQLESLKLWISANSQDNTFPAIDSCITGISAEECIRLYESNHETVKKLKKIPQSQEVEEAERENESILDLKDLRNLTVGMAPSKTFRYRRSGREMMNRAITFISEEHALKLMYNLDYKIKRDDV